VTTSSAFLTRAEALAAASERIQQLQQAIDVLGPHTTAADDLADYITAWQLACEMLQTVPLDVIVPAVAKSASEMAIEVHENGHCSVKAHALAEVSSWLRGARTLADLKALVAAGEGV